MYEVTIRQAIHMAFRNFSKERELETIVFKWPKEQYSQGFILYESLSLWNAQEIGMNNLDAYFKKELLKYSKLNRGRIYNKETKLLNDKIRLFLTSHSFCQAFFGKKWKKHLQKMIVYKDPGEYLREYMTSKQIPLEITIP